MLAKHKMTSVTDKEFDILLQRAVFKIVSLIAHTVLLMILDEVQLHRSGSTRSNTCQRSSSDLNVLGHCASTDTHTTNQSPFIVDW